MKERVLALLKPTMQPKGFKADELESIAETISRNLKAEATDEDIKAGIESFMPIADLMQRVGNRYATGVETKYKGYRSEADIEKMLKEKEEELKKAFEDALKEKETRKEPDLSTKEGIAEFLNNFQTTQNDFKAALQKSIAEQINLGVAEALKPYRERDEKARLSEMLNTHPKVKGMPETFRKAYTLKSEDELENLVSQMETDYSALKLEIQRTGEFVTPPAPGNPQKQEEETISFLNGIGTPKK